MLTIVLWVLGILLVYAIGAIVQGRMAFIYYESDHTTPEQDITDEEATRVFASMVFWPIALPFWALFFGFAYAAGLVTSKPSKHKQMLILNKERDAHMAEMEQIIKEEWPDAAQSEQLR